MWPGSRLWAKIEYAGRLPIGDVVYDVGGCVVYSEERGEVELQ